MRLSLVPLECLALVCHWPGGWVIAEGMRAKLAANEGWKQCCLSAKGIPALCREVKVLNLWWW